MAGAKQMLTRQGLRSAVYDLVMNTHAPDGRTLEQRAEVAVDVELTEFDRDSPWIARRIGEPMPLDEEMGP